MLYFSDCPPLLIFRVLRLPEPDVFGHMLYQQVIIIYPWPQLQQPGEVGHLQQQAFFHHQPSCAAILESLDSIGNVSPDGRKLRPGWVVVVRIHYPLRRRYYHVVSSASRAAPTRLPTIPSLSVGIGGIGPAAAWTRKATFAGSLWRVHRLPATVGPHHLSWILHHWSQIPKLRIELDMGMVLAAHSALEIVVEVHQHPTWLS